MGNAGQDGLGTVIEDTVVAPGGHWSRVIERGNILRIIDLEGCQAVDFLCYNAKDPSERYNAADTMKIAGSIFLGAGTALYSGMGNKVFMIVLQSVHDSRRTAGSRNPLKI